MKTAKSDLSPIKIPGSKNNKKAPPGWRKLLSSQPVREPSVERFTYVVGVTMAQLFSMN